MIKLLILNLHIIARSSKCDLWLTLRLSIYYATISFLTDLTVKKQPLCPDLKGDVLVCHFEGDSCLSCVLSSHRLNVHHRSRRMFHIAISQLKSLWPDNQSPLVNIWINHKHFVLLHALLDL